MRPTRPTAARLSPAGMGVVLGIDTGLQRTGYAFLAGGAGRDEAQIIEAGVIRLDPRRAIELRLVELEASLSELIAAHGPHTVACEELYAHYKHPRTAILMGHARGVVLALAARRGLPVLHVAATRVKKTLTGNGHSSKLQMQRAVAATLRLTRLPEPNDVADAIAIALCGLRLRQSAPRELRPSAEGVDRPRRAELRPLATTVVRS